MHGKHAYTPNGKVSGSSPRCSGASSQSLSSGCTARVSSMCTVMSNCSGSHLRGPRSAEPCQTLEWAAALSFLICLDTTCIAVSRGCTQGLACSMKWLRRIMHSLHIQLPSVRTLLA